MTPTMSAREIADLREIDRPSPLLLGAVHQGPWLNSLTAHSPSDYCATTS